MVPIEEFFFEVYHNKLTLKNRVGLVFISTACASFRKKYFSFSGKTHLFARQELIAISYEKPLCESWLYNKSIQNQQITDTENLQIAIKRFPHVDLTTLRRQFC